MKLIYLVSLVLFISCVGEIENANLTRTKGGAGAAGSGILEFQGVDEVVPISHDKAEVYFYPASTNPTDTVYNVTYDGLQIPLSFSGSILRADYRGKLKALVTGLNLNTTYNFFVTASYGDFTSDTKTTFSATTFPNKTANFFGISKLSNVAGTDGKTTLQVEWPAASILGNDFSPADEDPLSYEVILLNSNIATPIGFDDNSLDPSDRKVYSVSPDKISFEATGLKEGTTYYARVRTIHQKYSVNAANPNYKHEENNQYMVLATLGGGGATVEVDLTDFSVAPRSGQAGKNTLDLRWGLTTGPYDHFRIYYHEVGVGTSWGSYINSKDSTCNGIETSDPLWTCKQIQSGEQFASIYDLKAFTEYEIKLLICLDVNCSTGNSVQFITPSSIKTSPEILAYDGFNDIKKPTKDWMLDSLALQVTPPDLSTGYLDGLAVEIKKRDTGEPFGNILLNHPDQVNFPNTSDFSVESFEFQSDTEIIVRGLEFGQEEPYCFSIYPYWHDGTEYKFATTQQTIRCLDTTISVPTGDDFEGAKSNSNIDLSTRTVTLFWDAPTNGLFDSYKVFLKVGKDGFSYEDAKSGVAGYYEYTVGRGETSYQFYAVPTGDYAFGVLTNYSGTNAFSEDNSGIYQVDVP